MKITSLFLSLLVICTAAIAGPKAMKLNPPTAAPETEGTDQEGKAVKFADVYKANKFVVVYFYPKADTPGCTKQGCSLRDAHGDLTSQGVKVIGVSHDTVKEEKDFSDKFKFPFTLIADSEGKVIKAFNVVQKPNGMASRECFLIKEGKIVWHDPAASTDKQADDLKAVLAELK